MIEAADGSLYTGITTDIARRFNQHCDSFANPPGKGAKFFYGREPVGIVYLEKQVSRSLASSREAEIKKLKPGDKHRLKQDRLFFL
jgi:putative endonuclease